MVSPTRPYIVLEKPLGQTPLQALEAWKQEHPAYASVPMTYAGRLDPMAEGILLVLVGEECKRQDRYRGLDKEYEIEVLLDLATDTGDVLGLPTYAGIRTLPARDMLRSVLHAELGTKKVPYPAYSSKTVDGTPLFQHTLEGSLDAAAIPVHEETTHRIEHLGSDYVEAEALRMRIVKMLALAPRTNEPSKAFGMDFRQDAIRSAWTGLFDDLEDRTFAVLRLRVTCGSGTYMRSLAGRIGSALGTSGMALSIRRTRIGTYRHALGAGLWTREYR